MAGSIHDVAKLAGVSPRTVSNVVNDFVHVRPQTRERVLKAIEEVGYRPNIAAKRLRQGRTGIIGFVVPELSQPYFAELVQLLETAAERHGYTVMATQTLGSPEREHKVLQDLTTQLVDGVIFSPMGMQSADFEALSPTVPVVLIGEQVSTPTHHTICIDNIDAAKSVTEHLILTGRQRIATLGAHHSEGYRNTLLRLQGYKAALQEAGVPFDEDLVLYTDIFTRRAGREGVARALANGVRFDAVMCFTDVLAYGAIRALADAGLGVPHDVAIAGVDDIQEAAYSVPTLTTISPDKEAIVDTALSTLLSLIGGNDEDPIPTFVPHELVIRESSAAVR